MTDKITGLHDLRPGDLMFGPIGGIVPGLFPVGAGQLLLNESFRIGPLAIRHVGVVVEGGTRFIGAIPRLVQAMPHGAEEIELTAEHWSPRHAYVRLPEDYPGQADDAAAIARLFVSERVPYSFLSYAYLAAWRFGWKTDALARWIDRRGRKIAFLQSHRPVDLLVCTDFSIRLPREAICSVLADQAWTLTGKDLVQGTRPQIVTPGQLAAAVWDLPGVIRGGAGLLESR